MAEDRSYIDVNTRERRRLRAFIEGVSDAALAAPANELRGESCARQVAGPQSGSEDRSLLAMKASMPSRTRAKPNSNEATAPARK